MQISIRSPGANTPVFIVDGLPDFSELSDPTLAILQSAYNAGNYEIIPEPEPINNLLQLNWLQFYKSLKVSATYQYLIVFSIAAPNISGVMAAMGIAIQDGIRDPSDPDILPAFQASVSGVLASLSAINQPLNNDQLTEVRTLLDNNGFNNIQLGG